MVERQVRGEMVAFGWRTGSSGRLTGDIEGLYEGYRWGGLEEQDRVVEVAHGSLALVLRHSHYPAGRERGENPFAGGKDPLAGMELKRPELPAGTARPSGRRVRETTVTLLVDGGKSASIYHGASGEMTLTVPNLKDAGYMVVSTGEGDLQLSFLEWREDMSLVADLWVDGQKSTGIYQGASGELHFKLDVYPQDLVAIGPYAGTIQLAPQAGGRSS